MIRSFLAVFVFSVFVAISGNVKAADSSLKVAVVRIQDAFSDYNRTKAMKKDIEETFKPDQTAVEKLDKEVKNLKNQLRADTMTEPGSFRHFEKLQVIRTKEYLLKTMKKDLAGEWNERMVEFWKVIYADFQKAVKMYSVQNGYDIVIRQSDEALSNKSAIGIQNEIGLKILHYVSPAMDKTKEIVAIMNRNWSKAQAARGRK
ncbi:MAG: OmpH/Skp family outer membrane protein [Planctomycetota bacterium]|jgi:Skp family chaperone for outer membrane proteins